MGIFYNPSLPPIGSNAATPPEPHVPVVPQGDQPPRYTSVLMLAAVLASWPLDLGPQLARPNEQQQKIAPLALVYGSQPQPPLSVPLLAQIASTWSQAWDTQTSPKTAAWNVPAIATPQLAGPTGAVYLAILQAQWGEAAYEVRVVVGGITAPTGDQPPRQFALNPVILNQIAVAWIGPPAIPSQSIRSAPLVLTYGQPPPPYSVALQMVLAAWPVDSSLAPRPSGVASLVPPPIISTVPYTPPLSLWSAWIESAVRPPTPSQIAPLTLPYGVSPGPQPPLPVSVLTSIAATWTQTWDAQTTPKNAAWNVPPILAAVPYRPLSWQIVTAWEPPWIAPPPPIAIAPLTLSFGIQPQPQFPLSVARLSAIVTTWAESWSTQTAPKFTVGNVPPIPGSPYTLPSRVIWAAWEVPWIQPPLPVTIVTLTLPTGDQLPVQPPLARTVIGVIYPAWPLDLEPRLGQPNAERVHVVPLAPSTYVPSSLRSVTVVGGRVSVVAVGSRTVTVVT